MRKTLLVSALAVLVLSAGAASAADPVCGDVNDSSSVSSTDALLVLRKSVDQPVTLDCSAYDDQFEVCEASLAECEASGSGLPVTGQTTAYGAGSDGDVQAGLARSFTDNGDGTITDNLTGLMWEKKDDSNLEGAAGIHDKDNVYTWGNGTTAMDGDMVTTFLATLNNGDGFAGHTDWRVPNQFELFSLVNLEVVSSATYPVFNTGCSVTCTVATCSCTQSDYYWSSTTNKNFAPEAWAVFFFHGATSALHKQTYSHVRAVRAGS
jgi:hypothetical protein